MDDSYVRRSGSIFESLSIFLLYVVAFFMVAIVIFQQCAAYNPVPIWDMQEGYLGFLEKISNGDWSAWFAPHNEHRIIISRLMFWVDNYVFHGNSVFLVAFNSILIAANVLLLSIIGLDGRHAKVIFPLLVSWCFLLCQGENITWAFQGQFHLAYLIPLIGLYLIIFEPKRGIVLRMVCIVFLGWLSIGTMGNGVVAMPLFLLLSIVLRRGLLATLILTVGTVIQFAVLRSLQHGSPPNFLHTLLSDPILFSRFYFRLIGSPFYYLLGSSDKYWQAEIFGFIFVVLFFAKNVEFFRREKVCSKDWALAFFIGYVFVSYAGATVSRMALGIDASIELHYTTPAILAWAALALLYSDWIGRQFDSVKHRIGFAIFSLLILFYQFTHIAYFPGVYFDERVSFLGLAMGVDDQSAQRTLTSPDFFRQIKQFSEAAYQKNLGYFQDYPYSGIRTRLGTIINSRDASSGSVCKIMSIERVNLSDPNFVRFSGVVDLPLNVKEMPNFLTVVDSAGVQIGFGLVKNRWIDRTTTNLAAGASRFQFGGYAESQLASGARVMFEQKGQPLCESSLVIAPRPYVVRAWDFSSNEPNMHLESVRNLTAISGTDSSQTDLCARGLKVLGTYGPRGDADTGEIELDIKSGESFLYRSGPTGGNQFLMINHSIEFPLPIENNWIELSLAPSMFKDKEPLEISIVDRGKDWGEWSAIAVKASNEQCIRKSLR